MLIYDINLLENYSKKLLACGVVFMTFKII